MKLAGRLFHCGSFPPFNPVVGFPRPVLAMIKKARIYIIVVILMGALLFGWGSKMLNDITISENFKLCEFESPDTHEVKIDSRVLRKIQNIREHFGKPVIVTSGYRTPEHNKKVRGVANSYHMKGMAIDWYIKGVPIGELAKVAEQYGFTGIGQYRVKHFIHTDIREKKTKWVG